MNSWLALFKDRLPNRIESEGNKWADDISTDSTIYRCQWPCLYPSVIVVPTFVGANGKTHLPWPVPIKGNGYCTKPCSDERAYSRINNGALYGRTNPVHHFTSSTAKGQTYNSLEFSEQPDPKQTFQERCRTRAQLGGAKYECRSINW